jgi:hypothetical protein
VDSVSTCDVAVAAHVMLDVAVQIATGIELAAMLSRSLRRASLVHRLLACLILGVSNTTAAGLLRRAQSYCVLRRSRC